MGLSQDISKLSLVSKLILLQSLDKMVRYQSLCFTQKSASDVK